MALEMACWWSSCEGHVNAMRINANSIAIKQIPLLRLPFCIEAVWVEGWAATGPLLDVEDELEASSARGFSCFWCGLVMSKRQLVVILRGVEEGRIATRHLQ